MNTYLVPIKNDFGNKLTPDHLSKLSEAASKLKNYQDDQYLQKMVSERDFPDLIEKIENCIPDFGSIIKSIEESQRATIEENKALTVQVSDLKNKISDLTSLKDEVRSLRETIHFINSSILETFEEVTGTRHVEYKKQEVTNIYSKDG